VGKSDTSATGRPGADDHCGDVSTVISSIPASMGGAISVITARLPSVVESGGWMMTATGVADPAVSAHPMASPQEW
jgi:hypothetical protein